MKNPLLFFLINPFLGLIQGFRNYKEPWAKNCLWLFVAFFGFTMIRLQFMDSFRYAMKLQELYNSPLTWDSFIANFYSDDGSTVDIYQPLVTYLVSFVTDSGNVLFAVYGTVFGFFYSRNIWFLFEISKGFKIDNLYRILIVTFAFVIGYWTLSGVRMWTAAHIFFYGCFLYFFYKNKKGLLIAATSVLVHFSFILPVSLLFIYLLIKLPWRSLYLIYFVSFFVSELNIKALSDFLDNYAPAFLLPKLDTYTNEDNIESSIESLSKASWNLTYMTESLNWYIFIIITCIFISNLSQTKIGKELLNFFGFTLLILTIGNIMSVIPSGGRYLIVAQLFGVTSLFAFYTLNTLGFYKRFLFLFSPLLLFFIFVSLRQSIEITSLMAIIGNPLVALFFELPVPIIDLIKQ